MDFFPIVDIFCTSLRQTILYVVRDDTISDLFTVGGPKVCTRVYSLTINVRYANFWEHQQWRKKYYYFKNTIFLEST